MKQENIETLSLVDRLVLKRVVEWYHDYGGKSEENDLKMLADIRDIYRNQETLTEENTQCQRTISLSHVNSNLHTALS